MRRAGNKWLNLVVCERAGINVQTITAATQSEKSGANYMQFLQT